MAYGNKGSGYGYSGKKMGGRSAQKMGGSVLETMKKERMMKMRKSMGPQMTGRRSSTGY